MPRTPALLLLLLPLPTLHAQVKHTTVPLADVLSKTLTQSNLTSPGSGPFHLRLSIAEPQNPQSPYQATIEEWWSSPSNWRRELTGPNHLLQRIVMHNGDKSEEDTGDYLPLWLANFALAAFDPVPDSAAWSSLGLSVDIVRPDNSGSADTCIGDTEILGSGDHQSSAFHRLCFDRDAHLKFYGSPRYTMTFLRYTAFGTKTVARQLEDDPEPGTHLIGVVSLEPLRNTPETPALFTPLSRNDSRYTSFAVNSTTIEKLAAGQPAIAWPAVHSGHTSGTVAMYLSADSTGQVREAWPLSSDNAGLEDPARQQVLRWKLKPAIDKNGKQVQVTGPLSLAFGTNVSDPLPELTDAEVRALAVDQPEPQWPVGRFPKGTVIEAVLSVDESGKLTGVGFSKTPADAVGPMNVALSRWHFHPLIRDGRPQYFHAKIRFVVP